MEDASLEDFLDGGEADGGSPDQSADTSTVELAGAAEGTDDGLATYAWSPDGGVCGACGRSAERRWRDEEGLVCADCKEW